MQCSACLYRKRTESEPYVTMSNSDVMRREADAERARAKFFRDIGNTEAADLLEQTAKVFDRLAGGVDGCDECGGPMDCPPHGPSGIKLCTKCK